MRSILINSSILITLGVMGVQDLKYRAISWYAFPVLAFLFLSSGIVFSFTDCAFNMGFVLLNLVTLTLFFSLKQRKMVNLLDSYLGPGDVLLLLCLAFYFPVLLFFLYYLVSLILISLAALLYIRWLRPGNFTVPLAGLQSLMLMPVIVLVWSGHLQLERLNDLLFQYLI